MPSLALKAHFDGKQILLDEPYPLSPSARLMVLVMPESDDDANAAPMDLAAASLNRAYGDNEPEYSLADVRTLP
jgi:hypothetical protein